MNQTARVLVALAAGLAIGAGVAAWESEPLLRGARLVEPLGAIWINAIRMTVVPLVLALVINGVAGSDDLAKIGRLGARALPIFLAMLIGGGVLAIALGAPAMSGLQIPPEVAASLQEGAASSAAATPPRMPSITERIIEIIPVNPVRAAADAAMLPLVVFALALAIALTRMDETRREPIVALFRALGEAMFVLVRWILLVAPIGVFALSLGLGMRMGASAAGALLYYIAVLCAVLIVYTLLLYPLVLAGAGVALRRFAAAAGPAQGIALSSRSSLAAMPATVEGAREHLHSPPVITGVALPLAVSVFRPNVPMAWVVGVLFLGKLYGVEIDYAQLTEVVLVATLLSFSVPGIPSASLFLLSDLLANLGIPIVGVGILIAVDAIPDMFKTGANVTSHVAIAALLGRRIGTG